jgi:hypothetical protein
MISPEERDASAMKDYQEAVHKAWDVYKKTIAEAVKERDDAVHEAKIAWEKAREQI